MSVKAIKILVSVLSDEKLAVFMIALIVFHLPFSFLRIGVFRDVE